MISCSWTDPFADQINERALAEAVDPRAVDVLAWYNVVGAVGCTLWIATYGLIALKCFRDKAYGVPLPAMALCFAWEALSATVWKNPVPLWRFFIWAWLLTDLALVWQLVRYGRALQSVPEVRRFFHPVVAVTFALSFVAVYTFVDTFPDRLGLVAANWINLLMSVLFISMYFGRRGHGRGISVGAAWCKMIGTALTAVQSHYIIQYFNPELPRISFVTFLCASVFVIDALYIALVSGWLDERRWLDRGGWFARLRFWQPSSPERTPTG